MDQIDNARRERLLHRRQFIAGPRHIDGHPSWKRLTIDGGLFLTVHPELPTEQVETANMSLTLLGYIVDPFEPTATDFEICDRLARRWRTADEVIADVDNLSGRFAIILEIEEEITVFHDAAAMRQIFHTADFGERWFASQPNLIAEQTGLAFDSRIDELLLQSPFFKNESEYWYPGDATPYAEILRLLPNHYLKYNSCTTVRFWPTEPLAEITAAEAADRCAQILQGILQAGAHRFDLAMGITAGVDSRLLLAASREVSKDILYYSLTPGSRRNKRDVDVPAKLLPTLGLTHQVVEDEPSIDKTFSEIFKRNVTTARVSNIPDIYRTYLNIKDRVVIIGVVSEVTKCFYHRISHSEATPTLLTTLAKMGSNQLALEQFENWLEQTGPVSEASGINLSDLFYWEQRSSSWASMNYSESDIAHETFFPYNCRLLLSTCLSVNTEDRTQPACKLHTMIGEQLWPEAYAIPCNPPNMRERVGRFIPNTVKYKLLNIRR